MKKALIVQGGWEGHQPAQVADFLAGELRAHGLNVTISDTLDSFKDPDLGRLDLIVPVWTMGTIARDQLDGLLNAVRGGVGFGGLHGTCDAFRNETDYQFLVGGQFVAHPGGDGTTYTVFIDGAPSPITDDLDDFSVTSEQYYLHVDPGNTVLATTRFGDVVMPVAWTRMYGKGRVFYCSLGHTVEVIRAPQARALIVNGLLWAAGE